MTPTALKTKTTHCKQHLIKISMLLFIICGGMANGHVLVSPQSNLDLIAVVVEYTCGDQLPGP